MRNCFISFSKNYIIPQIPNSLQQQEKVLFLVRIKTC
jgi:hypothetical protein